MKTQEIPPLVQTHVKIGRLTAHFSDFGTAIERVCEIRAVGSVLVTELAFVGFCGLLMAKAVQIAKRITV